MRENIVAKIPQPRGCLRVGDRQEVGRRLEILDVAVLRHHRLLAVPVDDRRIRDGDFHDDAQKKTSVQIFVPDTPCSRRMS